MKFHRIKGLALFVLLFSSLIRAQSIELIHQLQFGQTAEEVSNTLKAHSDAMKLIKPDQVNFPLAQNSEAHLLVTKLAVHDAVLEKVVFTFADDQLVYLEAQGNVEQVFMAHRKDTARQYMDYQVYFDDLLFIRGDQDRAWLLTPESVHPNFFTWHNPYLDWKEDEIPVYESSAEIPDWLQMGANIEQLRPSLEEAATLVFEEELDGSDPNAQIQINAFGVAYAGFPRKIEARFGDGKLNVVWILTAKGEEDRIRQKLIKVYGQPIEVMKDWEVFENWTVLLRKDKPEVLLLTKELGQFYKKDFFNK